MAECKIPVRIDGYKCVEDMIQDVLNYTYKGKTLKEWADSISEPHTNAECSVCHTTWDYGTNYCPNCGADMREES